MKVAVITGAGSGLGAAAARRFAADGYHLVLGDLRTEGIEVLAQELGAKAMACDVAHEDQVAALIDHAVAHYGQIDCMINNAGILGAVGPIAEMAGADFRRAMAVMADGVFYGTKHAARVMGEGVILNTASIAGLEGWSNHSYTAAKHAVVGLTKSAAIELAARNIRVNAVAPGNVITQITIKLSGSAEAAQARALGRNPLPYVCTPEDIADTFAFLAGPTGRGITGQVLAVDAGLMVGRVPADYHLTPSRYVD